MDFSWFYLTFFMYYLICSLEFIKIINIFLKKRVTGGRKKNGMSKEHAVCRNAGRTVSASIRRQQEYRRDDQRAARPPVGGEVFIPEQPDPECRQHGLDVPDDGGLDLIDALEAPPVGEVGPIVRDHAEGQQVGPRRPRAGGGEIHEGE